MPLVNLQRWTCNVELKLNFAAAGNDNTNGNLSNITFTMKDTKLYVLVVTLTT